MRVLLDEDVPTRLRLHFTEDLTVDTAQYRGWKGLANGALLRRAQQEFDVLVTMDDNLPDQQNLRQFGIGVAVLRANSKRLEDLVLLLPELERRLPTIQMGEAIRIVPPPRPDL